MRKKTVSTLSVLFLLAIFCFVSDVVEANSYTNVSASEAKFMIDSNPSLVVLDVRTQGEYDSGHIRNAKLIPVGELEGRLSELNTTDEILVYCRSGGRSSTASQILVDNGFQYIYNMLGGITAWIAEGYPVFIKYSSIQEAINNADEGDTIYVSSGTYYENVIVNKTVSLIGEDEITTVIDGGDIGTVINIKANSVNLSRFMVRNGGGPAILLNASNGNTIQEIIISNDDGGIYLSNHSDANTLNKLTISGSFTAFAINLKASFSNIITFSRIYNNRVGIRLASNGNEVINSTVSNNTWGIVISTIAEFNTIVNNDIVSNDEGITLEYNGRNEIFHNNFVNNIIQAKAIESANNTWNDGYPSGGNYWSDYAGFDLYSGPYQNESGSDGIGDTPYVIDANNTDSYPFMRPYVPWDITGLVKWVPDGECDIRDIATVAIRFGSINGDGRYDVRADITGEFYLVPDDKIDIRDIALVAKHFGEEYT